MAHMVYLNGRLVPAEQAVISVFDRGFLYGDGLFETVRVSQGRPFRWPAHWERFCRGLACLKLECPASEIELLEVIHQLVHANRVREGILRVTLSRGSGARGYSPKSAKSPTLALSLSETADSDSARPLGWKLHTAAFVLPPANALSAFKNANKLPQILARMEADDAGADEAIVMTADGYAAEATSSSLFWIDTTGLCAPPLSLGGLPSVSRATVIEIAGQMSLPFREALIRPAELFESLGVFLSTSTHGIVEALALDGRSLPVNALVTQLWQGYQARVRAETHE